MITTSNKYSLLFLTTIILIAYGVGITTYLIATRRLYWPEAYRTAPNYTIKRPQKTIPEPGTILIQLDRRSISDLSIATNAIDDFIQQHSSVTVLNVNIETDRETVNFRVYVELLTPAIAGAHATYIVDSAGIILKTIPGR